jgi:hypothetical protein
MNYNFLTTFYRFLTVFAEFAQLQFARLAWKSAFPSILRQERGLTIGY